MCRQGRVGGRAAARAAAAARVTAAAAVAATVAAEREEVARVVLEAAEAECVFGHPFPRQCVLS